MCTAFIVWLAFAPLSSRSQLMEPAVVCVTTVLSVLAVAASLLGSEASEQARRTADGVS